MSIRTFATPMPFSAAAVLTLAILFASLFVSAQPARAESFRGYEALQYMTTGNGTITMKPGEVKELIVGFVNIGDALWVNEGSRYNSLYTREPNYRKSPFYHSSWKSSSQPAVIKEARAAKGEKAHITFKLQAPQTTGVYTEVFQMAAEDRAWVPGTRLELKINVTNEAVPEPAVTAPVQESVPAVITSPEVEGLSALLLLMSQKKVVARGGEAVTFKVGIKNTGTKAWGTREIRTPDIAIASVSEETHHATWVSETKVAVNASGSVAPGALEFIDFTFKAPRTAGLHTVRYALAVDNTVVPNFWIDIPVEVTSGAPEVVKAPVRTDLPFIQTMQLIEEPLLRVGVLIIDEETDWQIEVSCAGSWKLEDENHALLGEMKPGEKVLAFYKNGVYNFNRGKGLEKSSYPIRFVPDEKNSICKAENFDRRVSRGYTHPDNEFRNVLEIRYNSHKDRTWLINELPMDLYLRGLAETSNISHIEYQKALITAARTYAFYHWSRNSKRVKEGFHVTAYADDQVYNGYGQEKRSPNITKAVQDSAGIIVTYQGEYAITPYFSKSDGRTRAWSEVWGGSVPWLDKSVPTPCDAAKGYPLWGHGVGMSAHEALCMANNGQKWDEILKYFYQGIDLTKTW